MSKQLETGLLLDYYGDLLTDTQRSLAEMYYNDDLSLSEISENTGTSRQGVYDGIKRAETLLRHYEDKLGLMQKAQDTNNTVYRILCQCKRLQELGNVEAAALAKQIQKTAATLFNGEVDIDGI